MSRTGHAKSIKRFLKRDDGETITIINQERTGEEDKYGDPKLEEKKNTVDEWHLERTRDTALLQGADGSRHPVQARLYVPGDVKIKFGLETRAMEASQVIADGEKWKVIRIDNQVSGDLKVCLLRSMEIVHENL